MFMASAKVLGLLSTGAVLVAISIVAVARPASKSPFATKKPKAWQTQAAVQPTVQPAVQPTYQPPQYRVPQSQPSQYQASQYQAATNRAIPQYQVPQYQTPRSQIPTSKPAPQTNPLGGGYYPGKKPAWQSANIPSPQVLSSPIRNSQALNFQTSRPQAYAPVPVQAPVNVPVQVPAWANKTYQQRLPSQVTLDYQAAYEGTPRYAKQQRVQYASNYGAPQQPVYAGPAPSPTYAQAPSLRGSSKPSWMQRLGSGNLQTTVSGRARVGVAAVDRTGADVTAESIADFDVRGEVSAITEGGLEYGAGLRVRAQRDRFRRGFGGLVGDCPAGIGDCTSVLVGTDTRLVKGHTSQFYTGGPDSRRESEFALEGAYLFLRSAYGDFVVGRDDGSAYLFSIGAPSLVAVNASNSPVDYTGLDSVKTFNDASGFAEKIAYTSPRLLGDSVGVGVQIGLSYAPNARACGVDYCVKSNLTGATDPFGPEIENIFEVGLALDRKFTNGLSAELTGTYAHGSENSGLVSGGVAVFDSLDSYGLGLELKYEDFTFGTSFLKSNNGFAGQGDYIAYDAGLTWKPSNLGFTASYGHADDDIAHITSDQGVFAVSYDLGKIRLGTGVQYIRRDVPNITLGGRAKVKEEATALFVEVGVEF